jgi:uncharacterized repeat protein (TIGR03843 family)
MSNWERVSELTPPLSLDPAAALELLRVGTMTVEGRVTNASNATLYCRVELDGLAAACAYKPISGERPLWDFPDGTLAGRELASYLVSEATGWNLIPPTVLRDGPLGPGMVQLWVAEDDEFDVIATINGGQSPSLQRIAVLDAVLNNSDRKVSHLLAKPLDLDAAAGPLDRQFAGIDHGISFAVSNKLRTVLWQWAGQLLPADSVEMLAQLSGKLDGELGVALEELLTRREVTATKLRVRRLLKRLSFPMPPTDWPAVPYPPY